MGITSTILTVQINCNTDTEKHLKCCSGSVGQGDLNNFSGFILKGECPLQLCVGQYTVAMILYLAWYRSFGFYMVMEQ